MSDQAKPDSPQVLEVDIAGKAEAEVAMLKAEAAVKHAATFGHSHVTQEQQSALIDKLAERVRKAYRLLDHYPTSDRFPTAYAAEAREHLAVALASLPQPPKDSPRG